MTFTGIFFKLIYFSLVVGIYWLAFRDYAPWDVTQGLWLQKPAVVLAFIVIFTAMILIRLLKILISRKGKFFTRFALTLFLLPYYVFISLFLVIVVNGYRDPTVTTTDWQTNLVYFKDAKIACITAGITDTQIKAGVQQATILFVPGKLCRALEPQITAGQLRPFIVTFSSGRLGIPYIISLTQDTAPR